MTAPVRNQNEINVQVKRIPLDSLVSPLLFIAQPGTEVFSLLFNIPAGVTAYLVLGQQYPIPLDTGSSSYDMTTDCLPYIGGVSIQTDIAYAPGTYMTVVVGGGKRTA